MSRRRHHDYDEAEGHAQGVGQGGDQLAFLRQQAGDKEAECRTCVDFKTWLKSKWGSSPKPSSSQMANLDEDETERAERQVVRGCPPDSIDLGRGTWQLLHTMAANLPEDPLDSNTKQLLSNLISSLSHLYPCSYCAQDFRVDLEKHPIKLENRTAFQNWLCEAHNRVNLKLGKEKFDCKNLDQRWNSGWNDGRCDY